MDEAIRIIAASLIGGAFGYVLCAWRRVPDLPIVEDIIDFVSKRKPVEVPGCVHSFTERRKDGWHCEKCDARRDS